MIGTKIKILRVEKNISQKDLAKLLNVSPSTIGMYEQERRTPDADVINRIADIFNCSSDYLLGRVDHQETKKVTKEELPAELADLVDYIEILKDSDINDITPQEFKEIIEFAKKIRDK